MPITIQYQPNANLVGQAAFEGGYGEYLRAEQARQLQLAQFAEQQRQFNERQGMAQQEFDANRDDMRFRQEQVGRQDYLQRYALQQRAAEQQAQAANQQMALDYGLQREAMQGQLGLEREYLQQQGSAQREAMGNRALMDRTRFEAEQKAAAADEMNLRAAIQRGQLDNDQIDEAWRRLEAKWPNVYNGTQPPPLPDWQSQDAQWAKATPWAEERGLQLVPDENGMPSIMRGTPSYPQTKEGMAEQHQYDMEKETFKDKERDAAVDIKHQQADEQRKIQTEQHLLDQKQRAEEHRQNFQLKALESRMPREPQYTKNVDGIKTVDYDRYNAAMEKWQGEMEALTNKMINGTETPSATPEQQGPVPVTTIEEARKLPKGTRVVLPDGRIGVVK